MLKFRVIVNLITLLFFNLNQCQAIGDHESRRSCEPITNTIYVCELCGVSSKQTDLISLIYEGKDTVHGDWPWLVAIFTKKTANVKINEMSLNFICGGSLISKDKVLTAAQCLLIGSEIRHKNDLVLKFGGHNLRDWTEESQSRYAESIIIRSDYNSKTFQNDIAIITLTKKVIYNDYTRPVCLWTSSDDRDFLVEKDAIVVGWGLEQNGNLLLEQPQQVNMPIVTNDKCKGSGEVFHSFTSNTTLCAGNQDGSGPCQGDSGGGLYVQIQGKWYIRGIVSQALPGKGLTVCDLNEYVIFTDVAKYRMWIERPEVDNEMNDRKSDVYASIIESKSICGVKGDNPTSTITQGNEIYKGEWPWLAGLFHDLVNFGFSFRCTGTIISNRIILTASECIENESGPHNTSELVIKVGVYKLNDWTDSATQTLRIDEILRHPNFSKPQYMGRKFPENNIAHVKLSRAMKFNRYVKPICLWDNRADQDQGLVYRKTGNIVGWGGDNMWSLTSDVPMKISVPLVNETVCKTSNELLNDLDTDLMMCGGFKDGMTGPCGRGYNGAGLYVQQNGRWTIRGLFAFTFMEGNTCNHKEYHVYTDLAKYYSWINQI